VDVSSDSLIPPTPVTSGQARPLGYDLLAGCAEALQAISQPEFDRAIDEVLKARGAARRVYIMGNGGSAATATHFASDLAKATRMRGIGPIRASSLTDNVALLTAWANDTAYDRVFAEQLLPVLDPADVVVAITVSGRSRNVLRGLSAARERRAATIGLLGGDGGAALEAVDIPLLVSSWDYGIVESAHLAIVHAMVGAVRAELLRLANAAQTALQPTGGPRRSNG